MESWIQTANHEATLIDRMRALLRGSDGISFAELDQLDGFRGDQALLAPGFNDNLVIWPAISAQGLTDLATLIAKKECHIGAASIFTYFCDGRLPRLPIAAQRRVYTRPHWLPAVLLRGSPRRARSRQAKRQPTPRKRQLVPGKLRARR